MKRKIIITFDDADQTAAEALARAGEIVAGGYRSTARGFPHYCWVTTWRFPRFYLFAMTKIKKYKDSPDSIEFIRELKPLEGTE